MSTVRRCTPHAKSQPSRGACIAPSRIARARQWLPDYADSAAGRTHVVLALVGLASGESLALTTGSPDGVWIATAPARWLAPAGRRVGSVHNHPEGRSTSPAAMRRSIADLSMLGRSAIKTVEVCTARGLVTATTVGVGVVASRRAVGPGNRGGAATATVRVRPCPR